MYQALVWACLVWNGEGCKILEDQRGPYESYNRCQVRALEMSEDVHIHMIGYKATRWKCRPLPKGRLTAPLF